MCNCMRRGVEQSRYRGHDVTINDVESNGKHLYAVRVNRFKSKKKADIIGKDIKSKIGVEYRVLYRPISKN